MSGIVMTNAGEAWALELMVNKNTTPVDLQLCLYTTKTVEPVDTDIDISDYGELPRNVEGYERLPLLGATWNAAVLGAPSAIEYSVEQVFLFTPPATTIPVYGYMVVKHETSDVLWAERFTGAPYNITAGGDEVRIPVRLEAT